MRRFDWDGANGLWRRAPVLGVMMTCCAVSACGWSPSRPFERNAPAVDKAMVQLADGGGASAAVGLLESYLQTGACANADIAVGDLVRDRGHASLDLGLALFRIAEQYGRRFGEEDVGLGDGGPDPAAQQQAQLRSDQVSCALKIVSAIAASGSLSVEMAARAHYLAGNLEFLRRGYHQAVTSYDDALKLVPGVEGDAGDRIGADAAWNRAIALRRIEDEDKRDAGPDAEPDAPQDASNDAPNDAPQDARDDSPKDSGPETGADSGSGQDSGGPDGGAQNQPQDAGGGPDAAAPPPEPQSQDDRVLDKLEAAPMLQLQDARNRAARRRARGMVDK